MFSLIYLFAVFSCIVEAFGKYSYPKGMPCKMFDSTKLDCSSRELTSIPPMHDHTVRHVKNLNFSYNQLETVNMKSFIHLTSLQKLDLSHNAMTNINLDTSLSLQVLDLRYNKIRNISTDTFTGLKKLQELYLSHNQLETVQMMSFIHLTSLQILDLSHNSMANINLDKTLSLQVLNLSYNKIRNISTYTFTGLKQLESLDLSHQTHLALHGSPFRPTQSLRRLDIAHNGLSKLPSSVFIGLHELQTLNISWNSIDLPAGIFQGLTNLTRLHVSKNAITSLPVALFEDLISLEYLDLSTTAISSLPETLFVNLISLQYLDLSNNRLLSSLPETLFVNLTQLTYLDISENRLSSSSCTALEGLELLSTLDISGNIFHYVPCYIGNMIRLKELIASYSPYLGQECSPEYISWNATKWAELITKLPASLTTLCLDVCANSVFETVMPGSLISSVSSLEISYCSLSSDSHLSIEDDAFSMFPYLQNLSIYNPICFTENKNSIYLSKYAFRNLSRLKTLNLRNGGLTGFPEEALKMVAETLKHLDLSYNNIHYPAFLYGKQYISLQLESLDVSRNPVAFLNLTESFDKLTDVYLNDLHNMILNMISVESFNSALRRIYISASNIAQLSYSAPLPLCTLSPGLEEITLNTFEFVNIFQWGNCTLLKSLAITNVKGAIFDKEDTSHFPHLYNLKLSNFFKLSSIDQFLIESRSLQYLNLSRNNIVSITENDLTLLGNLINMDLSWNNIVSLPDNKFHLMSNLTYLNLAANKLATLNGLKALPNLQTLIVSGNVLTTLPAFLVELPYNLHHLEFGDNPFSCTCVVKVLQDWILTDKTTYIDPQPTYLCASPASRKGHGIAEFSLDCRLHLENYILPSFAGLLVICIISAITYKYRWRIHYKLWILFYQRRYQRYIDNDDDADIMNSDDEDDVDGDARYEAPIMRRQYHAYVAYHRESEAWINDQLILNIEDGHNGQEQFRLCLKERGDIPAGHYILNAICHGISKSRKTIAVLSENFMDDGWCHYQLQIAQMRLVMDNDDVLILVQIGEIPANKKTMLLRQIMRNKEVLIWTEDPIGQELFWNKLRMELRKPARVDRRFEQV
ncbi:uncharacterized protein [Amphiura filiformis]|uniref:uncharacterized protein n=1 Tax=Amphiura filiformis TaxID=82378 RepID=UPI003B21B958